MAIGQVTEMRPIIRGRGQVGTDEKELIWAAGLFEGEGCATYNRSQARQKRI